MQMQNAIERTNADRRTIDSFGMEWSAFDQAPLSQDEADRIFQSYFGIFPFDMLAPEPKGFDCGCGSGRWAKFVAPKVKFLACVDPSEAALAVAQRNLSGLDNLSFHCASANDMPLADSSQDFGYSLGVLHHIPDTELAMKGCVSKLKSGAYFLVYLYYRFDNRPLWFRALWRLSDPVRRSISRLPFRLKKIVTDGIAYTVYWPLARSAKAFEAAGLDARHWPLHAYRNLSMYTLRTDALDRFGTRLEQRFSRQEIEDMMRRCGLADIKFADGPPYWVAVGRKA